MAAVRIKFEDAIPDMELGLQAAGHAGRIPFPNSTIQLEMRRRAVAQFVLFIVFCGSMRDRLCNPTWSCRHSATPRICIVSGDELVLHVDANDVTISLIVPNNNSSEMQLVPHVTIDVSSTIEVPNNNSGPHLVPHVATKVTIVVEIANNNSSRPQDGNSDMDLKPGALFAIGDCATSIAAIVSNPPSSGDLAYLVAVGIVFIVGVLAVLATLWVSRDARKRRTAKGTILFACIATFILGLVLNVYAYKVKNKK